MKTGQGALRSVSQIHIGRQRFWSGRCCHSASRLRAWSGVIAPAGLPRPILDKLNKALNVALDVAVQVLNGLEATRQVIRDHPSTKVIVLSSYSHDEYVQQLTEAGASGYLEKQTASNDLLKAIREAFTGNAFFSPLVAKRLRDHCRQRLAVGQRRTRSDYLTTREAEVLQLIAEGRANKQIAAELGISRVTLYKKLHRYGLE